MGCNSSSSTTTYESFLYRKPQIYFIGGGPGSNKGKIIEYLIRDYKLFYLSMFQILQFEKERNGADAEQIKKCLTQKKDFSSEFIVRLLKKGIASLGPRRYLIDGFPRNINDIEQFERQNFRKQVLLQRFIQIQVSDEIMKSTGMQAKKEDKRPIQEVQKEINQVISDYRKTSKQIVSWYQSKSLIIKVDFNNSVDQTYNQLRLFLSNLNNFRSIIEGDVKVFFATFDPCKQSTKISHDIAKKYGFYYLKVDSIISEAKNKNSIESKFIGQCENKKEQLPSEFILSLIRKKIQKKDYLGKFLIEGFPRNINDASEWDRTFGWQTSVQAFLSFTVSEKTLQKMFKEEEQLQASTKVEVKNSKLNKYLTNKKVINSFYQKQEKLCVINLQNQGERSDSIRKLFDGKLIEARKKIFDKKLIFMSTINNEGAQLLSKVDISTFKEINMAYCYQNQIKENTLYSDLIESYISTGNFKLIIGSPLPGDVAVKILIKNINFILSSRPFQELGILVKGFPNCVEQLLTWQEQIGQSYPQQRIILFEHNEDYLKKKGTQNKYDLNLISNLIERIKKNSLQLQSFIQSLKIPHIRVLKDTPKQQMQRFLQ